MPDMRFDSIGSFYYAPIQHGQSSKVMAKLDCGSPITLLNAGAVEVITGAPMSDMTEAIKNSGTVTAEFKGYNGIPSTIYLCSLHNVYVDEYCFKELLVGVSLDYPIGKDGGATTKCLIGTDVVKCCQGSIAASAIELEVIDESRQSAEMKKAFHLSGFNKDNIYVIDNLEKARHVAQRPHDAD